ncbi:MAG: GNAT family N-acetyltransferase [Lachnospiraceae bacterium]|nr:GNAT family N-acetyltransferase [Lachnospiraceae bacterium]
MLNHKGTKEIRTKRLLLRKYRMTDSEQMFKNYANDERVTTYLTWKAYEKVEDIKPFLEMSIQDYEKNSTYHWVIEYEGEVIGSISVMSVDNLRSNCEVGYCIGYDYWNKGITSEALAAVLQYLFDEVGMHRVLAKHDVDNPASGEVMKKCGMVYEGRFREYYLRHDGTYSDALVYGIVNA